MLKLLLPIIRTSVNSMYTQINILCKFEIMVEWDNGYNIHSRGDVQCNHLAAAIKASCCIRGGGLLNYYLFDNI